MDPLLQQLHAALAERYRIERELGPGGMAFVFLAHDLKHDREVALKILRPEIASALGSARFVREIRISARLNHPNILGLYDSGEVQGLLYFAMPYIEGGSLRAKIQLEKQLAIDDSLRIAGQVADALDYAHRHGVVHRDIKPGNILLAGSHALVADFGLARAVSAGVEAALTQSGIALGTPSYMSPEQAGSGVVDHRADQYSLACVLYEMLAGQPPFTGPTVESVLHQHMSVAPRPVQQLRSSVPAQISHVVDRALAKVPADRYPTTARFAESLAEGARFVEGAATTQRIKRWPFVRTLGPKTPAAVLATLRRPGAERWINRLAFTVLALTMIVGVIVALNMGDGRMILPWARLGIPRDIHSLVVMPLENLSGDPEQEFFADGVTDELTTRLAGISSLHVISRTTAMRYKGSNKTGSEIARKIGVDALVEGSVARSGDRVRIRAQLIRGGDDRHLWAEAFDRDARDILSLQGEVALTIARHIHAEIQPREHAQLARNRPVDPEVYELYLRGRFHWNMRTEKDLHIAIGYFDQAVAMDPHNAQSYAGLADCYSLLHHYGPYVMEQTMPRAKQAALRALEIDSLLAEAHASLGGVAKDWEHDWDAADREFKRAIELRPNYAPAHHWRGVLLAWRGDLEGALSELRHARQLDPLSFIIQGTLARVLYLADEYDAAVEEYQRAIMLDPDRAAVHGALADVYHQLGQHGEAAVEMRRQVILWGDSSTSRLFPTSLTKNKPEDYLRPRLSTMRWAYARGLARAAEVAAAHAVLGDRDSAFAWLEHAQRNHSLTYGDLRFLPDYDGLRTDPMFAALVRRAQENP